MNTATGFLSRLGLLLPLMICCNAGGQGLLQPLATPDATTGPLAPLDSAGNPQPTMKTLDQVEPRVPIDSLPFTITNAGAYYVAAPLLATGADGILIRTGSVTLDLSGFTISGTPATSQCGVKISADSAPIREVIVRNGVIKGFDKGILAETASGCVFQDLRIRDCAYGINAVADAASCGNNEVIDCIVSDGVPGIIFQAKNGGTNAGNRVEGCLLWNNSYALIFNAVSGGICRGSTVHNCMFENNALRFYAYGGTVEGHIIDGNIFTRGGSYAISQLVMSGGVVRGNIIVRNVSSLAGSLSYNTQNLMGPTILDKSGVLGGSTTDEANPWANFRWTSP